LLPSLLQDKGWEKQLDLHAIFPKWKELVRQEIWEHAMPLKIDRGVLWLEVENSSWLAQLQYDKIEILEAVNSILRIGRIKDVKMVLPKKKDKNPYFDGVKSGPAVQYQKIPAAEIEQFKEQISGITDEKCRESLMQFWYLAHACKRTEE
jgi:hypothetical protein